MVGLGATSLATVMQMVANGYGVTLVPQVAVDVEVRDERVKLLRFAPPQPGRTIGLAWRRTSPRKADFWRSARSSPRRSASRPRKLHRHAGASRQRAEVSPCRASLRCRREAETKKDGQSAVLLVLHDPASGRVRRSTPRRLPPRAAARCAAVRPRPSAWLRGPRRSPGRPPSSTAASCRARRSRAASPSPCRLP